MPIDYTMWKLTLPTGPEESPTEITSAALRAGFVAAPYFAPADDAQRFRAPVNGVTTPGSNNPRCELREMTGDGKTKAAWSSSKGWHRIVADIAFTALPSGKPGVGLVGVQIHDTDDDVSVFRLEGNRLWVTKGDKKHVVAVEGYTLGTRLRLQFVVWADTIQAWCDGRLVSTIPGRFARAYFKAGAYTQINAGASPMAASNYGETLIYRLTVEHLDRPPATTAPAPAPAPIPTRQALPCPHCGQPVVLARL